MPVPRSDNLFAAATASDTRELPAGAQPIGKLGQYVLLEKVGQGGMGTVFKAFHSRLKKVVALKTLPAERMNDPEAVARFNREMLAIGKLEDPHIIRATDAGEADGKHFLVTEFVDGMDLSRMVAVEGPLPIPAACAVVRQAALGLQFIHEHGLVHRDIKPSNLILSGKGQVKILDLGLARLQEADTPGEELTPSGQMMGTRDFMAPEQALSSHDVDIRADIYSLGCSLYKLLSGKAPFSGPEYSSAMKKIMAHAQEPVPPLASIPVQLTAVIERMMAKEPADRFAQPAEVAHALEPFANDAGLVELLAEARQKSDSIDPATTPGPFRSDETGYHDRETKSGAGKAGAVSTAISWCRRQRWLIVAACLALVAGMAVVLWPRDRLPDSWSPGIWHNLLKRRPGELIWPKNALQPAYDAKREELLVACDELGLVHFGTIPAPGYKFRIDLRQHKWTGGVGIFFGFHDDVYQGEPCRKCQMITLEARKPKGFTLTRRWAKFFPARQTTLWDISSEPVTVPVGFEPSLEVHVDAYGGLQNVRWGSDNLAKLCDDANTKFPLSEYQGAFGVVVRGTTGVFREARLMTLEKE